MNGSLPRLTKFADGITAVDTEYVRPQMDASHVVVVGLTGRHRRHRAQHRRSADPGRARRARRRAPDAVDFLFLTHVHLDHAGGAGALMRALPRATAVVHPRGAPHMIDPGETHRGDARRVRRRAVRAAVRRNPADRARAHRRSRRTASASSSPGARSNACTRPAMPCITRPSSTTAPPASSPATPSGSRTANSTPRAGRGSCRPPRPRSSIPAQLKASIVRLMQFRPRRLYLTHYSEVGRMRAARQRHVRRHRRVRAASRAPRVSTPARMRFELRALGARKPARSRLHADRRRDRRHSRTRISNSTRRDSPRGSSARRTDDAST